MYESIDTHIMVPVENIPGTEAKMALKLNVSIHLSPPVDFLTLPVESNI